MDPAVALVQAYLQLLGYLTVTEFPITTGRGRAARAVTDIDLIAVRFPTAQAINEPAALRLTDTSPLTAFDAGLDLLICEVKEGKARLNPNLNRRDVLATTLRRVGCCPPDDVDHHVESLMGTGRAHMAHVGVVCQARVVVFAGRSANPPNAVTVSLAEVARAVLGYLDHLGETLRATRFSQPALAHLALVAKLGVLPPKAADHGRRGTRKDVGRGDS